MKILIQLYIKKLKKKLGNFKLDNPKTKNGLPSFGLFQESYKPVSLHTDTGFDFKKIIFKQFLLPLSPYGETVIFKNRFYGCSTTFSIDPMELKAKGYNKRSSKHLKIFKVSNIKTSLSFLKTKNFWVSAFDVSATKDFTSNNWSGKNVLLFGSEGFGLKSKTLVRSDFKFKVKMNKNIESLNISNTVSVVCHHIFQSIK